MFWSILEPLLWSLPFLMFVAIFPIILKSPTFKGWLGEKLVQKVAHKNLSPNIYHGFHNVTLPLENDSTQIDHIYVSKFGVFVVETKNYKGWIYGKIKDAKWTQNIYGKKYFFQNPLRQNYKHIKALEILLNLPSTTFQSVIVFTGDCELKSNVPANICRLNNFCPYILSLSTPILTETQVSKIRQQLATGRLKNNLATRRTHIRNVKSNLNNKNSP